jgi:hypothetical protein
MLGNAGVAGTSCLYHLWKGRPCVCSHTLRDKGCVTPGNWIRAAMCVLAQTAEGGWSKLSITTLLRNEVGQPNKGIHNPTTFGSGNIIIGI